MKQKTFIEALDISRVIFYDLNAKRLRFNFRSLPEQKLMIFTAVEDADTIKSIFPQFDIQYDNRQQRFVELIINYE